MRSNRIYLRNLEHSRGSPSGPPEVRDWERLLDSIRSNETKSVRDWFKQREAFANGSWGSKIPTNLSDPVFLAASVANYVIHDLLIRHGFPANRVTSTKHRRAQPIHMAATKGCIKILKTLLDVCDIPVDVEDPMGKTPLMYAACSGQREAVRFLVNRGAEVNASQQKYGVNTGSLFNKYVASGNVSMAEWLHSKGAHADVQNNPEGFSAFHYAMRITVQKDMLKFLIRINAPLNQLTIDGHSALRAMLERNYSSSLPVHCLNLVLDAGHHVSLEDYQKAKSVWKTGNGVKLLKELQLHMDEPMMLQKLCCFKVRKVLGKHLATSVDKLPVPQHVKDFISLKHLTE